MSLYQFNLRFLRVFLMITLFISLLGGNRSMAQDPDFSKIKDILAGRRQLLPVDDLIISVKNAPQGASVSVGDFIWQTQDSKINATESYQVVDDASSSLTEVGRMFNFPYDVIFTAVPGEINVSFSNPPGDAVTHVELAGNPISSTMADFTGDSFADVALLSKASSGGVLRLVTRKIPSDPLVGPLIDISDGVVFEPDDNTSLVGGDFNGDGRAELAVAQIDGAQVRLDFFEVVTTLSDGVVSHALNHVNFFNFQASETVESVSLVAGDYDGVLNVNGLPDDELVLIFQQGQSFLVAQSFEICPPVQSGESQTCSFDITAKASQIVTDITTESPLVASQSSRLNWFGKTDQLVVAYNLGLESWVEIYSFDTDLKFKLNIQQNVNLFNQSPISELAIGQFDQDLGVDADQGTYAKVPNLQIGILSNVQGPWAVAIYDVDPENGFLLSLASVYSVPLDEIGFNCNCQFELLAGDTQGRSLRLGPPDIVRIEKHHQPDLILGAPPMHVDFVTPVGKAAPEVFNLSAVPNGFNSAYDTMDKSNNQSSRKSTTSFTYGFKESLEDKTSYGIPDVASISNTFKFSAQQTHNNTVSKTYNTYVGKAFNASTKTGFGDQLRFMQRRFNLYIYPVIGHSVCPNGLKCPPALKHPLHVIFSGPDRITNTNINASNVEWYQASQEMGNVFSYPANQSLLNIARKMTNPDFDLNTTTILGNTTFFTDTSTQQESIQWSTGSGKNISVGSSSSFSFDESDSISAMASEIVDEGVPGLSVSGSVTFSSNQSKAVKSLKTTVETVGESTGVTISKTGNFANPPLYQYGVKGLIFGQPEPPGSFQKIKQSVDQQTTGPLEVGFTANPLQGGSWWSSSSPGSYTTAPDIALNHPVRWSFVEQAATSPLPANCLQASEDQMDCFTFNAPSDFSSQETCPNLDCLWSSEFHWMRGLLITPADAEGGPQITQATAGDKIRLQARVYNYSLHQTTKDVSLHARFYRQEWQPTCPDTGVDCQSNVPIGESVLIEEVPGAPVDSFNEQTLNWTLVETTLDTTDLDNKYFIFWVVVWLEDENGALVTEVPQHGLKNIPGVLTSIADAPIESYSNNVGYYHLPFYVFSKQNEASAATSLAEEEDDDLVIENITLSSPNVIKNEKVEVTATISTGNQSESGVNILFYDGDPEDDGKIFDIELISHIRANEVYQLRIPFRPSTCGIHEIYVVAADGSTSPPKEMTTLEVVCPSGAFIDLKGWANLKKSGWKTATAKLDGKLEFKGKLNWDTATLTLTSLFNEAGKELLKGPKGQTLLPLTLEASYRGKKAGAIFKTSPRQSPKVRVEFKTHHNHLKMTIRINRKAVLEQPQLCSGTPLKTALEIGFRLEDGTNQPIEVSTVREWMCGDGRNGNIRSLRLREPSRSGCRQLGLEDFGAWKTCWLSQINYLHKQLDFK